MLVIGEKINGTRQEVAEAIVARNEVTIQRLALAQVAAGASYLDINAGTRPENEPDDMVWLIRTVKNVVDVALCLDSANPEALRAGLAEADRLPMINSVSGERHSLDSVLPLAADHGTPLILLALDDAGIPPGVDDRMAIIERLIKGARQRGLTDDKLFIDPLVTTIATDQKSALTVFDTMRRVKASFPEVHLTCGLSNISFGQPMRALINQAFAAMAVFSGLDCAIMDPEDKRLTGIVLATEMLMGLDPNCLKFNTALRAGLHGERADTTTSAEGPLAAALKALVDAMTSAGLLVPVHSKPADAEAVATALSSDSPGDSDSLLDRLEVAMVDMREDDVTELTEIYLSSGGVPLALLETSRKAMTKVGELFETQEYFVPELILAGEMLGQIAEAVKPHLRDGERIQEKKGRVLIGTVEGDIHDIGKDIVVTMLDINGYEVMDLGVDVSIEAFVAAARDFKPQVIGLSGFLTLAYEPMKNTIAALRDAQATGVNYMIGGGQMNDQVARYVNADAFGKDALEAVKLCDRWIVSV